MMVYVFGIDVPLIELMLVTIASFIIMFFFSLIFILRVAKKEEKILETTKELIESEQKVHHVAPKVVKKEGFFAKLFAAPEKPKKISEENLTKKRNKEIFKKPTKSIFAVWNDFWSNQKNEAEKTWQRRYNVETKKYLQEEVAVQSNQPKQESWWEKHKKDAEAKAKQREIERERIENEKQAKIEAERRREEEARKIAEKERKTEEIKTQNPKTGNWLRIHKLELAKEIAEEKKDALLEARERARKEKEWKEARRNSWWERHKREVAKRPDPEEQLENFWQTRKHEAENSWKPKLIEAPPKPHEIEGWWHKHMRRVAEEKARKQREQESREKQRADEQKRMLDERRKMTAEARKAEETAKKAKVETWWEKHQKAVKAKKVNVPASKGLSFGERWSKYWKEQRLAAKSWRKK